MAFAMTGNPNCSPTKDLGWQPAKASDDPLKCLDISEIRRYIDVPEAEHIAFWDKIFKY